MTDDFSAPLTESVPLAQIRPQPPQVQSIFFNKYQVVDAFDNDGTFSVSGAEILEVDIITVPDFPGDLTDPPTVIVECVHYLVHVEKGGLHLRRLRPDLCEGNALRQWGGKVARHHILVLNYVDIAGEFWVVGEISDIQRDWYFIACANKVCGKKLQEINDQMYCKSCDQQSPNEIIKYKLVIDILDDEQDGQLILWDNVCSPLLGITTSELKGKYSEEGCMPNEIEGLIGKTMKFMIVTREDQFKYRGNAAFTVLGVQADEAISNSFKKGEQGSVIRKLAEEKEFNENFGQVKQKPEAFSPEMALESGEEPLSLEWKPWKTAGC
nr:replication factor A protein 1-like [Ipomoea batatas]